MKRMPPNIGDIPTLLFEQKFHDTKATPNVEGIEVIMPLEMIIE
jgi:hypothetical protein